MKKTIQKGSMPGGIAAGLLWSITATLGAAAIAAKTVEMQWMEETHIRYIVMVMLLLSSWLGAAISYRKIKQQKAMVCLAFALAFCAVLLGTNMLFFDGQFSGAGETGFLILGGSFLTIFTQTGNKQRKMGRRRKRQNR